MWKTGIAPLDDHLGGGLPGGLLVDVHGMAGAGKTQLAYHLLKQLLMEDDTAEALVVHTEGRCPVQRLCEMLGGRPAAELYLDRVVICHPSSPDELLELVNDERVRTVKAVVIDSIAQIFRYNENEDANFYQNRSGQFVALVAALKKLPLRPLLLCLNHVSKDVCRPALGLSWNSLIDVRIALLVSQKRQRQFSLISHPWVAPFDLPFAITVDGLSVVDAHLDRRSSASAFEQC